MTTIRVMVDPGQPQITDTVTDYDSEGNAVGSHTVVVQERREPTYQDVEIPDSFGLDANMFELFSDPTEAIVALDEAMFELELTQEMRDEIEAALEAHTILVNGETRTALSVIQEATGLDVDAVVELVGSQLGALAAQQGGGLASLYNTDGVNQLIDILLGAALIYGGASVSSALVGIPIALAGVGIVVGNLLELYGMLAGDGTSDAQTPNMFGWSTIEVDPFNVLTNWDSFAWISNGERKGYW